MNRHAYLPPKARLTDGIAALGGVLAAVAVFTLVPLSQNLAGHTNPPHPPTTDLTVAPPPDFTMMIEPPPPDQPEKQEDDVINPPEPIGSGLEPGELDIGPGGVLIANHFNFRNKTGEDPVGPAMDSPPIPVNRVQARYPRSLLKRKIGGKVIITCVVDTTGQMVSSTVKSSSGQPLLDQAALSAVRQWKFKPATRHGKPSQATCNIPFTFQPQTNSR